jgi:NAD(P)-dependent dehydrogenase (short-subunit alcohol dehydrogenase family)
VETAVVTGAGRGFGREIARLLAQRGYAVLCTDVDVASAEEAARELGEPAWAMALDARDPAAHRAAARAAAEHGQVRVWVNNAGIARSGKGFENSDDDVRLTVETNLLGVMWGTRAAIDAMRNGGGDVLNIASMSAFGAVPGLTTYAATKHGVLGYTSSIQGDVDNAGLPIRLHTICPDAADTQMVRGVQDDPEAAILFSAPKLLDPTEVAARSVALIGSKKMVLVIPRWRALVIRGGAFFPRFSLKVFSLLRRQGERKLRKEAQRGAGGSP